MLKQLFWRQELPNGQASHARRVQIILIPTLHYDRDKGPG